MRLTMATALLFLVAGSAAAQNARQRSPYYQRVDHAPVFVADRKDAGHQVAKRTFVGKDCQLCSEPGWTVHRKDIR